MIGISSSPADTGIKALDFTRIAILGPGLLGGSLAMAIRRSCPGAEVHLWARRESVIDIIRKREMADLASTDLCSIIRGADLVILATPVGTMGELARCVVDAGGVAPACVVTDVGSVKEPVMQMFAEVFHDSGFFAVGSHPMAGSEKTGIEYARADLFEGAACAITPPEPEAGGDHVRKLEHFWQTVGMRTWVMEASQHDRLVAKISHLPHLVAAAMVEVAFCEGKEAASLAGAGFLDSTRIAAGAPEMWTEILLENRFGVVEELKSLQVKLGEVLAFLEDMDEERLMRFLSLAKDLRDSMPATGSLGMKVQKD